MNWGKESALRKHSQPISVVINWSALVLLLATGVIVSSFRFPTFPFSNWPASEPVRSLMFLTFLFCFFLLFLTKLGFSFCTLCSPFVHALLFDLIRFLFVLQLQLSAFLLTSSSPSNASLPSPVRSFISLICSHLSDAFDGKFIIMQICKLHSNSNLIRFASNYRPALLTFSLTLCACPLSRQV